MLVLVMAAMRVWASSKQAMSSDSKMPNEGFIVLEDAFTMPRVNRAADSVPPVILDMLYKTANGSGFYEELVEEDFPEYASAFTAEDLESFFIDFCKGVQYAYEHTGKLMDEWGISHSANRELISFATTFKRVTDSCAFSHADVLIGLEALKWYAQATEEDRFTTWNLDESIRLDKHQFVMLAAVEEAYHAMQIKRDPDKSYDTVAQEHWDAQEIRVFYENDPIEQEAAVLVKAAHKEMLLGGFPKAAVSKGSYIQ